MSGKAYRQNTRIHKIFRVATEERKVFFGDYEVFSSAHDVTYHGDIGDVIVKEIEDETDVISQAPTFTKIGWAFVGWRLDTEANPDVLVEYLATEDDIHVYAVFERTVTVSLIGGSEEIYDTGTQYYNNGNYADPMIELSAAILSGWTVAGYRTDTTPDLPVEYLAGTAYAFHEDTTLYALFEQTVTLYVTQKGVLYTYPETRYENNGNYNNPTIYVNDPSPFSAAKFKGYSNSASSTTIVNTTLSDGITIDQDTYRYAVWKYDDKVLRTSTTYESVDQPWDWPDDTYYYQSIYTTDGRIYAYLKVIVMADVHCSGAQSVNWAFAGLEGTGPLRCKSKEGTSIDPDGTIHEHSEHDHEGYPCYNDSSTTVTVPIQNMANAPLRAWTYKQTNYATFTIYYIEGIGRTVVY